MKKIITILLLSFCCSVIISSCKKNFADEQYKPDNNNKLPDLVSTITASVSGFITDESGKAVSGAQVTGGIQTVTTDTYGYFKINNATIGKTAGFIKVTYAGYFNGYRTFSANQGKETFIRLQLIPKTAIGTINAISGGSATTSDGGIVTLPANGVMIASSSAAYAGTVHIAAHWINPAADDLQSTMPGNLLGIDTAGYLKTLTTYGMLAVELTDDGGNLLQIASGKQATLSFPIPATLTASAPATIALWSFNETNGLWKQESEATKTGSNYVGNVSHFSYWNCDIGINGVYFTAQIIDSSLHPLINVPVSIGILNQSYFSRVGYTDTAGFVYGFIPGNSNLTLNVQTPCNITVYSKDFITKNSNVDLGTIIVNLGMIEAAISGTVVDCYNAPIINGYVLITSSFGNSFATIQNGKFNSTVLSCTTNSFNASIIATDIKNSQQTPLQSISLSSGTNNLDTISICNISQDQYLTVSVNGQTPYSFLLPFSASSTTSYINSGKDTTTINCISGSNLLNITFLGIADTGTNRGMVDTAGCVLKFNLNTYSYLINGNINITEYGPIGGFISGNFACVFEFPAIVGQGGSGNNVIGSFRVKRTG